jgi:hypothetical protein
MGGARERAKRQKGDRKRQWQKNKSQTKAAMGQKIEMKRQSDYEFVV